jgi:putative flippase GtrA
VTAIVDRAVGALKHRPNWIQLAKFGAVGISGYTIYIALYAIFLGVGAHKAAGIAFVVSAANNYWWNRRWTFSETKGHFGYQGMRFFVVSVVAFGANQLWLFVFLDWLGLGKFVAGAISILFVTPLNFLGNKLWSFRR